MFDAFRYLLCSKLCQYNRLVPSYRLDFLTKKLTWTYIHSYTESYNLLPHITSNELNCTCFLHKESKIASWPWVESKLAYKEESITHTALMDHLTALLESRRY